MTDGRFTMGGVATEEMASLRRATGDVVASALTMRRDDTLLTDATSRQVASIAVSEGFFELFGLPMSAGRSFEAGDYAAPVGTRVVISQHIWRGMFGGDPRIVGTTIRFAGISALVVGTASAACDVPRDADLWIPEHEAESIGHSFDGYVRLKPGLTTASVRRQLRPMWAALAKKYPDFDVNRAFAMRPLLNAIVGDLGPILLMACAATALLMVLAIVNVANLQVARTTTRRREIAIRAALGASRWDLLQPLLAESALIAAAATAVGVPLAYGAV